MLTALISIQTIAVVTASTYIIKNIKPKPKMRVYSNCKGFKHYKTF